MHAAMRSVCVYLSSFSGHEPAYASVIQELGREIARRKIKLIYGGASVGLMGMLAEAALAEGGHVIGVIPETLVAREVAHRGLSELHVVANMHQRKALLAELADGFVVAPGGFGTLEEAFEILTGRQIEVHAKPVVHLDVRGFWKPMASFLDHAVAEGMLRPAVRELFVVAPDVPSALELLINPRPAGSAFSAAPKLAAGSAINAAVGSVEPLDLGAQGAQAGVDALVAAVDLSDVVDGAGPIGGERG